MMVAFLRRFPLSLKACCLVFVVAVFSACSKEENITSLLNIVITDAPVDAENVSAVNIVIDDIEWKRDSRWESIQYLEHPIAVDVFSLTKGRLFPLINRYVESGKYTEFRFSFQVAVREETLAINPQSNIEFADSTAKYLYWFNDEPADMIVETDVDIPSRQFSRLIVDFNLRKSIRMNASGEYILQPVMRIIDEAKSGNINLIIRHLDATGLHVVGYVYKQGEFSDSEFVDTEKTVAFGKAITSGLLSSENELVLPFLEAGKYELIFVNYKSTGEVLKVLKRYPNVSVEVGETTKLTIDIEKEGASNG